jgi:hypothetical protein
MLRASWPRVSGGALGEGGEDSLSRLKFPSELHIDAEFELLTPRGTLYATNAVHVNGKLSDIEATGTELKLEGADTVLVTTSDEAKARLVGVNLVMRDSLVGEHATVAI